MNLEKLLETAGLKQEKLSPAETTTLITLLEYDPQAAEQIATKIKAQVQKREQIEALRARMKESFLEWLADANKNGICVISSLHYTAPDQITIRFNSEKAVKARSPRRSRSQSSSSSELLEKIEELGYEVNVVEEKTRGGNIIKKYAVKLADGSELKDQWLQRLYERLQKLEEGTRNEAQAEEE